MADTKIKAGQFHGVVGHGTDGYFLMTNADGSMSWAEGGSAGPSVTSVDYPGDDLAADPAGGQTVVLTGTNFGSSMTVSIGGTTAPSVAHDSSTQLTITTPAKAAGDYDIVITNTVTGASGTFVNGISYNGIPTWTTASGSLGTFESETTISTITLQATEPDGGTITFNITNGALPSGLSLTGANIDGTTTAESSTTLYSFTIEAIDDENQATPRNFSITVNSAAIIPSENFTINTYTGNGSTQSIEGKIGAAASFNGSSSIITGVKNLAIGESISAWFKTSSATARIYSVYNSTYEFFSISVRYSSGTYKVRIFLADGGNYNYQQTAAFSLTDDWHHIAVNLNSLNNYEVFIDGSEEAISAYSTAGTISAFPTSNTILGAVYTNGTTSYGTQILDQVRIFNRALDETTDGEVTTLYNETNASSTKSTTDIFDDGSGVALYEFEEGAKDTGGGASGYIGSGAAFGATSTSDGIVSGYAPSDMDTTSYTFSQFLYFDNINDEQYIFSNFLNSSGNYGFYAIKNNNVGNIIVDLFNTSNVNTRITSTALSAGQWYHLALTWNHSTKVMKLYIDGALDQTSSALSGTVSTNSNTLRYGRSDGAAQNDLLVGKLDQIRIFNAELDQPKIQELADEAYGDATVSTVDFGGYGGVALYELEGNANDTGNTYNSTSETNISYRFDGTPTNINFLGMAFQPDLVWIKNRDTTDHHALVDTVRGIDISGTKYLASNQTNAEATSTNMPTSVESNGFTLSGAGGRTNTLNEDYVAWCWKAGGAFVTDTSGDLDADISANVEAGFSIIKPDTQTAVNQSIPHGLDSAPELILHKPLIARSWAVYVPSIFAPSTRKFLYLERNEAATTGGAGAGTGYMPNSVTDTYIYTPGVSGVSNYDYWFGQQSIIYAFHSVDGYQKVGSYTADNQTTKNITTGFRPRFLLLKRTNSAQNWVLVDSLRSNNELYANTSGAEATEASIPTFYDDGFTLHNTRYNGGTDNYIYLAIA